MDVRSLSSTGFVTVSYPPILRKHMQEAMESWQRFCDLPLEQKQLLSGGDRINDFGYMVRKDNGSRADDKELFHALRANFSNLLPLAEKIQDRRATDFIQAIDNLIVSMESLVRQFARDVERHFGITGFEADVLKNKDSWVFRYLRYPPGARPVLANAHADRRGFTFHLGETQEGGEYYDLKKNEWRPWPLSDIQTIIFPSMDLQYRSRNRLKALWHRVVPNEKSVAYGRYSMVAFIDFANSHRFDDSRFRMQEFEPGFNYSCPFDEFQKLFVPC